MQIQKRKTTLIVAAVCMIIALVAAGSVLVQRAEAEKADRNVSMLLEWTQVADLAAREGITPHEAVAQLLDYEGAPLFDGILYKEYTASDLENERYAVQKSGDELQVDVDRAYLKLPAAQQIQPKWNYLVCDTTAIAAQAFAALRDKTSADTVQFTAQDNIGTELYVVGSSLPQSDLATLGLGFPQQVLDVAQQQNLAIVLQIRSFVKPTQQAVDTAFSYPAGYNVVAIALNDAELPGVNLDTPEWAAMCKLLADKYQSLDLPLVNAEFYKQKGFTSLAAKLDYNIMRMHPIPDKEVGTLTTDQVAQRFALACSERNMRLALVRMPKLDLISEFHYLSAVRTAIADEGLTLSTQPSHLPPAHVNTVTVLLIALGVAAAGMLLCLVLGLGKWSYVLAVIGFIGAAGLTLIGQAGLARKLLSLLAAIIFPTLAVYTLLGEKAAGNIGKAIGKLLLMSAISLVGALMMAALLSDRSYMTSTAIFSGVKVAQMLPLLLLLYLYWLRSNPQKSRLLYLRQTLATPVNIGLVCVGVVALAIVALFMLRSGNDAVTVSSWERALRSALDQFLLVRPRSKEFAFGHPLMLLLLYFGYKKYFLPLVVMAGIGQVSLVNTFSHLHTPLTISFARTAIGLVVGIVIGVILIVLVRAAIKLWQKYTQAENAEVLGGGQ